MKKLLLILVAAGILMSFTGCDWFLGLFGIEVDLSVDNVWVWEDSNGVISSVDVTFNNDGEKNAEEVPFILVFSADDYIDKGGDSTIYEGTVSWIDKNDSYDESIDWSEIQGYIDSTDLRLPYTEGYIGVVVDPNEDFDEEYEDDNTNFDWDKTVVPTPDDQEYNDDSGSALYVNFGVDNGFDNTLYPAGEEDWFKFDIGDVADTFTITVTPIEGSTPDLIIDLYEDPGSGPIVSRNEWSNGSGETISTEDFDWNPVNTGAHYIRVTEANSNMGTYTIYINWTDM